MYTSLCCDTVGLDTKFVPADSNAANRPSALKLKDRFPPSAGFPALSTVIRFAIPTAGTMLNGSPFDVPPPGAGLTTVTVTDPADTMSDARIAACTCVD